MVQKDQKKEKFKAWAQATCEHQMEIHNKTCEYPTYWYNCDDLSDAEITLDEMINRIHGSQCMIETRKKFYHWALAGNSIRALCDGAFDSFCDKTLFTSRMRSKVAEKKGRSSATIKKRARKPKKKKTTEGPWDAQSFGLIMPTEQFNSKSIYLIYIYFILGTIIFISILLALLRCIYIKRYRKKIKYEKISNATESETAVTQDESIIVVQ